MVKINFYRSDGDYMPLAIEFNGDMLDSGDTVHTHSLEEYFYGIVRGIELMGYKVEHKIICIETLQDLENIENKDIKKVFLEQKEAFEEYDKEN